MKNTCWKLFAFSGIDHKAAQAWLNQRAAEGWELVKLVGPFAQLQRTERTELAYFLDWTDSYYSEPGDYVQLCADAGWELVESAGSVNVYASRPGAHPLPIQTDPEVEYQRLRQKVLRRMGVSIVCFVVIYLIVFLMISSHGISNFFHALLTISNLLSFVLLSLPVLLLLILLQAVSLGAGVLGWKRAAQAGEIPPPPRNWALRLRRALTLLGYLYSLATLLLLLADALLGNLDTGVGIGLAVGSAIGGTLSWRRYKRGDPKRKQALQGPFLAVLYLVCILLGGAMRDVWPHLLPSGPLLGTVMDHSGPTHTETFLGGRALWGEYVDDPMRSGHSTSFDVEVRSCSSPWLAELAFGPIPADMEPVNGKEGVWQTADANPTYLIRRDNTQLTVSPQTFDFWVQSIHMTIGPDRDKATGVDILTPALNWLEQWNEVRA